METSSDISRALTFRKGGASEESSIKAKDFDGGKGIEIAYMKHKTREARHKN